MENFFARCTDEIFWADRERVQVLITLYQEAECLWNSRNADYKSQSKKKQPEIEIGKHFGLSGVYSLFLIEALLIHLTGTCRIDHKFLIAGV